MFIHITLAGSKFSSGFLPIMHSTCIYLYTDVYQGLKIVFMYVCTYMYVMYIVCMYVCMYVYSSSVSCSQFHNHAQ